MKYLVLLLVLLCGCPKDGLDAARDKFPGGACSWRTSDDHSKEVVCINEGKRFICIGVSNVQCALVNDTPTEGK